MKNNKSLIITTISLVMCTVFVTFASNDTILLTILTMTTANHLHNVLNNAE